MRDFVAEWPQGWTKRSLTYRQGFQSGFARKTGGICMLCGHPEGSLEFDAWFAGKDAGERTGQMVRDGLLQI